MGFSNKPAGGSAAKPGRTDYSTLRKQMRQKNADVKPMTKAEQRREKALAGVRDRKPGGAAKSAAHEGVSGNPLHDLEESERQRKLDKKMERGTSAARINRHGEEEGGGRPVLDEGAARDSSAAAASLGIASPLPRSILRPSKKGPIKRT